MRKYNHAFDVGFSLVNASPDGDATKEELLEAIEKRLTYLREHPEEVIEACGAPFDSHEEE